MKEHKILVVDDNPINLEIIINYCENIKGPRKIFQANNGKMALKVAKKIIPDLIIMDWEMPEMSGIEAVKELKKIETTKFIPIIMATAVMTSSENLKTALEAGAIDYLRIPIDPIELTARINSMLKLSDSFQEINELNSKLSYALKDVKKLSGLLPICAACKKIRDDKGYWKQIEVYIDEHSEAKFSHGMCPDCAKEYYPDYYKNK